jgi:hypothetical protein
MSEIKLGFWETLRNGIRNHLAHENIATFFNWNEIQKTMIAGIQNVEYEYLISNGRWESWKNKIKETKLKPNSHSICSESSTNNLHHAYSLQRMMEETGYKLNEFDDVVEFGGGYGNVCRLFKAWDHNKPYYSYDIPELIQIQKYYLNENNVINNVYFMQEFDTIKNISGNSLFIGLWSISEVPINERAILLENLKLFECKNIFIAMGGMFQQENNIEWLNKIIIPRLDILGFKHKIIQIKHGKDMFYFIATKK